jgi:2-polyprenyl-3-methyl-5-hydroxy-6-metoxy-1,4-benzoquinol methylase
LKDTTDIESSLKGHIGYDSWTPEEKIKYLKYFPKDVKTVLDVGCGVGELIMVLKRAGYEVEGCDFDPVCLEKSRRIEKEKIKQADAQKLSTFFNRDSFDLITCMHILEHLPYPFDALREIRSVTKKYALIAIPNARYITFDERETHLYSWNRSTFRNFAEQAGFEVLSISSDWSNLVPSYIKFSPLLNRVLLRLFYDPLELVILLRKR